MDDYLCLSFRHGFVAGKNTVGAIKHLGFATVGCRTLWPEAPLGSSEVASSLLHPPSDLMSSFLL